VGGWRKGIILIGGKIRRFIWLVIKGVVIVGEIAVMDIESAGTMGEIKHLD